MAIFKLSRHLIFWRYIIFFFPYPLLALYHREAILLIIHSKRRLKTAVSLRAALKEYLSLRSVCIIHNFRHCHAMNNSYNGMRQVKCCEDTKVQQRVSEGWHVMCTPDVGRLRQIIQKDKSTVIRRVTEVGCMELILQVCHMQSFGSQVVFLRHLTKLTYSRRKIA